MVWNGSGGYVNTYYPTQDRDSGIPILASKFENFLQSDLPQTFGNCITRDGQGIVTTDFNANNFKVKNLSDAVLPKDAVNKQQLDVVSGDLTTLETQVGTNTTNIGINTTDIGTNTTAIALNTAKGETTVLFTGDVIDGVVTLSQSMANFRYVLFHLKQVAYDDNIDVYRLDYADRYNDKMMRSMVNSNTGQFSSWAGTITSTTSVTVSAGLSDRTHTVKVVGVK